MAFFNELKRRNVFKVAVTYAVIAWLLIQVIDTVFPRLGVPEWAISGLTVMLILGFPVVLVVAWAFQMTPEGIKTQQVADDANLKGSAGKMNGLMVVSLVLALGFVVFDAYILTGSNSANEQEAETLAVSTDGSDPGNDITSSEEKSIAVLPFTNLSNDPDQEYFSDGLTEELINRLSSINDLLVTGRTSVFFFKNSEESPQQIAESLGVKHILQGTVRKSGNQLRISATLMDADSGFNLWTQIFDRQLADIFEIQDEIAVDVSRALSVTLSVGECNRPGMPRNVEAYDEMIRGYALRRLGNYDNEVEGLQHYLRGLELEPDSALLWYRLADVYRGLSRNVPQGEQEA